MSIQFFYIASKKGFCSFTQLSAVVNMTHNENKLHGASVFWPLLRQCQSYVLSVQQCGGYIVCCSQKVLVFNTSKKVTAAAFKMRYSHESLTKRRCAFFFIFFSFPNSSIQNGLNFILMDIYYLVFCVFMYFRNIFMIFSFIQKLKQLHRL